MPMKVRYTVVNGEVLSENRAGVERDYLPDTQGNVIGLLDSTQTITDTFSYFPYGEVASRTGTNVTPFQFLGTMGYYRDSASRTYVRARTLNTVQGRWMTQDPIGFEGGDYNLYRYVENSPTILTDPSGYCVNEGTLKANKQDGQQIVPCFGDWLRLCRNQCHSMGVPIKSCTMIVTYNPFEVLSYECECKSNCDQQRRNCYNKAFAAWLVCAAAANAVDAACMKLCTRGGGHMTWIICKRICGRIKKELLKQCDNLKRKQEAKCDEDYWKCRRKLEGH